MASDSLFPGLTALVGRWWQIFSTAKYPAPAKLPYPHTLHPTGGLLLATTDLTNVRSSEPSDTRRSGGHDDLGVGGGGGDTRLDAIDMGLLMAMLRQMYPEPDESTTYHPADGSSSVLVNDQLLHETLELFTRLNIYGTDFERAEVGRGREGGGNDGANAGS